MTLFALIRIVARLPGRGGLGHRPDVLDQAPLEVERRDQQLAELLRAPESRYEVEEVGDVGGDVLVGGEEADILVGARRGRVVVAGADVHVAAQPVALAADDERRLRVNLHVGEPEHDVDARLLELARPLDVAVLVEAGLQLDDADALRPVLRRLHQRRREGRVGPGAVHGRLQGHDLGIRSGGLTNASTLVANES